MNILDLAFKIDALAMMMMMLIAYIGVCVAGFSLRYMKGDRKYASFFLRIALLMISSSIMVAADHLWILFSGACLSYWTLVRLMIHHAGWKAAKNSGIMAGKNYLLSITLMASAFALLHFSTGQTSISMLSHSNNHPVTIQIALLLLLVAAMAQSAIWPFHSWLISSLNSPTPVSAMMHAGLINGGGFLLARFAKLYLQHDYIMIILFVFGILSALIGTLWKLIQIDVKRMLACSTMGQMGFMFAQCGLGLFPLAIGHLFWHGMFKAYLFLASSGAAQEKRLDFSYPLNIWALAYALIWGIFCSWVFACAAHLPWFAKDGTCILMLVVLLTGSQFALSMRPFSSLKHFILSNFLMIIVFMIYGNSTQWIESVLEPMGIMQAQPIHMIHMIAITALILAWFFMLWARSKACHTTYPSWWIKTYVQILNQSQPHQDTITAHRNHYQY